MNIEDRARELTKLVHLGSCAFVEGCHENTELAEYINKQIEIAETLAVEKYAKETIPKLNDKWRKRVINAELEGLEMAKREDAYAETDIKTRRNYLTNKLKELTKGE